MNSTRTFAPLQSLPWRAALIGLGLAFFHLLTSQRYGFHGDELYFVYCGQHAAWGYVDHPPLVPVLARFATDIFGLNLFALRLLPALSLGLACMLTGALARRLGAGAFGECLAAIAFVCAPMLLRMGAFLNIPSLEVLFWILTAHLLVSLERSGNRRWWLAIGLLCGVALLNKHTTLFLGTGIAAGILFTGRRGDLATPWPWLGGALALLFFLPNLYWQWQHDWATLEFVRNINEAAMPSRVEFVVSQLILMNLAGFVVYGAGVIFYFRAPEGRPFRTVGWLFAAMLLILLALGSKVYYLVPAYPLLMAGGAVLIERKWRGIAPRIALNAALIVVGLVLLPVFSPIGSIEWKDRYTMRVLGFILGAPTDLTFDFHNQLHRREELEAFAGVFRGLNESERAEAVILTREYDTAATVNLLGRELGLPVAISGNNTFYLWGPGGKSGETVIAFGFREQQLAAWFEDISLAATTPFLYGEHEAGGRPVYLCRKPKAPLAAQWPEIKSYR